MGFGMNAGYDPQGFGMNQGYSGFGNMGYNANGMNQM
jgi:hypothetical protein